MEKKTITANDLAGLVAEKVADLLSDQIYDTSESIIDEVKKTSPSYPTDLDELEEFCTVWCEEHGVGLAKLIYKLFAHYIGTTICTTTP